MYTVDVDVGGTLTDGIFSKGGEITEVKVDTTPHDLTVCLFECLKEGAAKLGFINLKDLMRDVNVLRWSSTITTNVLAERIGPKLGLIVTKGNKINLYGQNESPAVSSIIDESDILEIDEDFLEEDVLRLLRELLKKGVRRLVVSLKNGRKEDIVKKLMEEQFPNHYLGSIPIVVSTEICKHPDDVTRTHYSLIDAYTHDPLAVSLFKAEDQLKFEYGFRENLLIGLNTGGSCRISKAKAIDTVESGPVMGIYGSSYFAKKYKFEKVCSLDIGGTTTKFGIIKNGKPVKLPNTNFFGIPFNIPSILLRSLPIGGGTIVRASEKEKDIKVGPESMGGYPGPASYDLGGTEATITDALLILGFINPSNFLEGKRKLKIEKAQESIESNISNPLNFDNYKSAAKFILDKTLNLFAQSFKNTFREINELPENDYVLFAFGGNGALFAGLLAERLGINLIKVFKFGSVFSALGSSMSDVTHVYEEYLEKKLSKIKREKKKEIISNMLTNAERDLKGERFDYTKADYTMEIDIIESDNQLKTLSFSVNTKDVWEEVQQEYGDIWVKTLRIRSIYKVPKYHPSSTPFFAESPNEEAKKGERIVLFDRVPIYDYSLLKPGNIIKGKAIVEGKNTTYFVPQGWSWETDEFYNATIKRLGD